VREKIKKLLGSRCLILMTVIALIIVVGAGIGYYYYYQGKHYVTTDDARVAGDLVNITPEFAGKITSWNVEVGDEVKAGQILGMLDTSTVASSVASSLATVPGMMASLAEKANIITPLTGPVIQANVKVGQMTAQTTVLATVADLERLYISANIQETKFQSLQLGDPVNINIDAFPNKTFQGRLANIGQATSSTFSLLPSLNTNGNYTKVVQRIPVKITLQGVITEKLLPGMNANIKIFLQKQNQPVESAEKQGGGW
jgi:multidrug resistance efflux pump